MTFGPHRKSEETYLAYTRADDSFCQLGRHVWCLPALAITGTIDNKGQNNNFIDGESKNEVEKLKDHIKSMVQGCASFRFLCSYRKLKSSYEVFTKCFSFGNDEPSQE